MPGAKVVASSFDKSTSPATVALVGSISAKPAAVVAYYTKALEGQGFTAVPGNAVGSVASKDFVRAGSETVNIAVPATGGVSTFTIGANVTPESVK
jgi:predicted Rossmann fold nucleotide-binding protein DprA/Smf involved in DNA uptake